jgi:hypothetical protein
MKKNTALLLLFLAVITIAAYSQIDNSKPVASLENNNYIFCELFQQDLYVGSSSQVTTTFMNYGKKSTYQNRFAESSYVKQQKDGLDALNYLSENGWELVTKNVREFGATGIETVYLLRKKTR